MGAGEQSRIWRSVTPAFLVVFKAYDDAELTSSALLTGPVIDLGGDFVHPDGGRWAAKPYVKSGQPIVGKHEGLIGYGVVELKSYTDPKGKVWSVPVGTTHYERGNRLAEQTYQLVKADVMPGVSIEFRGIVAKSRGYRNKFEPRDAMDYVIWDGLGWSHDAYQQNQLAQTFPPEVVAKAMAVLSAGKLDGCDLHPVICKALSVYQTKSASILGNYERKAAMSPDPTAEMPADDTGDGADSTPPTAARAYDGAQQLSDWADQTEQGLKGGEHKRGKKKLLACIADARAMAEELSAIGDMIVADLSDEPDEADADAEPAGDETEPEMKAAPEPVVVPLVFKATGELITKTGYSPRRVLLSELKEIAADIEAKAAAEAAAEESADLAMMATELDALRRRNRKNERTARDLERARLANATH